MITKQIGHTKIVLLKAQKQAEYGEINNKGNLQLWMDISTLMKLWKMYLWGDLDQEWTQKG